MSVLAPAVRALLDAEATGVLGTVSEDGRPRLSVVYYVRDGDELLVSTEAGRWKARDAERTGWASLCVRGPERPFPSVTVAGPARVLTSGIGAPTARIMQRILGTEEPPEPQTDEALAAVGRVILAITAERVGPATYLE